MCQALWSTTTRKSITRLIFLFIFPVDTLHLSYNKTMMSQVPLTLQSRVFQWGGLYLNMRYCTFITIVSKHYSFEFFRIWFTPVLRNKKHATIQSALT